MIKKLLIANRGEIACRIMRSGNRLGIATVAVYSEPDANALHVRTADEARLIGPASAVESYLNIDAVLSAAKATGADAVHPGYGFLAENADFADAVRAAGLTFVGPPAKAIRDMGAKDNAKALMAKANVPIIPGYYGANQSLEILTKEAADVGYPVLLKAALGGGGKGMRIVHSETELSAAIYSAKREAASSFGDDRLLIERYLIQTRHIEVQIFADTHGNAVHLFERDCSLQRRHQKVVEEAPAPGMTTELREQMGAAAIAAATAVAYEGAGTIEFLLAPDNSFYFMEMNTRLQVEHPVSEYITGLDFVEWQIRVANGEPLPLKQSQIKLKGHAVEVRLYAEDPENNFMPAPGTIEHLKWPTENKYCRIDSGVEEGDVVSPHYDPMIAKIICCGETREQAIATLVDALTEIEIVGPGQNLGFLLKLLNAKPFVDGAANTSYVDGLSENDYALPNSQKRQALAIVAQNVIAVGAYESMERVMGSADPYSPWAECDGWRLGEHQNTSVRLALAGEVFQVTEHASATDLLYEIEGDKVVIDETATPRLIENGSEIIVFGLGGPVSISVFDPLDAAGSNDTQGNPFAAPMPGKITVVNVADGDQVEVGDVLVVLEAMKMEHSIRAPRDGLIATVHVSIGDQVDDGTDVLEMEPE
ncbi:MAG: acetyl-CoA carboxylase biotin carboxylase subunit [Rhodospirillales bacterium]|nr:acetyl-CoA carboxylase biotin carboxylase subunit [Rhodospirillales bacterium]